MKRIKTNKILSPEEFIKLNQCMECRKMLDIQRNSICEECKSYNRGRCKICECVLRDETENRYYVYYDNENNRHKLKHSRIGKKQIIEYFIIDKINFPKYNNEMCQSCKELTDKQIENYKDLNYCVLCGNTLVEELTPDNIVEYLSNYGQYCVIHR